MSYYLRELCRNDIEIINSWRNNRKVVDDLGSCFRYVDNEVDIGWFGNYISNRSNAVRLAICDKNASCIVGAAYLLGIDWVNRSSEFAIWIGETSHQGKGAGQFAVKEMLNHAFKDLNLNRIYLTVIVTNQRAINLYKKNGFVEEGRLRDVVFKNGVYTDMLQMSILAHEFLS